MARSCHWSCSPSSTSSGGSSSLPPPRRSNHRRRRAQPVVHSATTTAAATAAAAAAAAAALALVLPLASPVALAAAAAADAPEGSREATVWDYIVVGAGTGGSVAAGRLAEDGAEVLLLEAGMWDDESLYGMGTAPNRNSAGYVWGYPAKLPRSISVQNSAGHRKQINAGKVMGGSSAVHGDVYDPPPEREFEVNGFTGWDGETIRTALERLEADLSLTFKGHADLDGVPETHRSVAETLAQNLGVPFHPTGARGVSKAGFSMGWRYFRSGGSSFQNSDIRHTSYSDFVHPLNTSKASKYAGKKGQGSLTVVAEALVAQVIIDDETAEAIGVKWQNKAEIAFEAFAKKAVVLAAGAVGTPKVLMLSGIGDPYELQGLNVPVRVVNREVGRALQDHLAMYAWFIMGGGDGEPLADGQPRCKRGEWFNFFFNLTEPAHSGDGPVEAEARFFVACNLKRQVLSFGVEAVLLHPDFEGRVAVSSRDPVVLPAVEFPALWPRDLDRLEQIYLRLGKAMGFPDDGWIASQGFTLRQSIEKDAYLYQHPCCSARVARPGEPGVCDEDLQVRGVPGLYVADAAALPFLPSAHTSVPALLMGELASQSILKKEGAKRLSKQLAKVSIGVPSLAERRALLERQASLGQGSGDSLSKPSIPRAPLARSGDPPLDVPLLGLGTGTLPTNAGAFETSVATFLRKGGRLLDTAVMYNNAKELRMAIASSGVPSSEVIITWKVMPFGYQYVVEQLTQALKDFGRKFLDVALIHWPGDVTNGKLRHGRPMPECVSQEQDPETGAILDNWRQCRLESYQALEHIQGEGFVKAIGVSNFALRHLQDLEAAGFDPPAVHQMEVHPRYHDDEVIAHARQHGTQLQGYGCLGGRHTGAMLLMDKAIQNIASQLDKSRAQVLLRFAVELGIVPMTGGSTDEHIEENMRIFDFNFTTTQWEFLMSAEPEQMNRAYGPSPHQIL